MDGWSVLVLAFPGMSGGNPPENLLPPGFVWGCTEGPPFLGTSIRTNFLFFAWTIVSFRVTPHAVDSVHIYLKLTVYCCDHSYAIAHSCAIRGLESLPLSCTPENILAESV